MISLFADISIFESFSEINPPTFPSRRMESPVGGLHLPGEFPSCDSRWKPPVWFNGPGFKREK